jgi:pimeloyl-ACP methyl ester carboxylesterase
MLGVTAVLPGSVSPYPPVILVHGAANAASTWTFWQPELAAYGWASYAIDLCGHGRSTPRVILRRRVPCQTWTRKNAASPYRLSAVSPDWPGMSAKPASSSNHSPVRCCS